MINAKTVYKPVKDGIELLIEVNISTLSPLSKEQQKAMLTAELFEILETIYKKESDIVENAIARLCEEAADDKTDINNN